MGTVVAEPATTISVASANFPIRVLIIHQSMMASEALREMLSPDPHYEVVADCLSTIEAVEAIARHKPDLVFVDAYIPQIDLLNGKKEGDPLFIYLLEEGSPLIKRLKRSELTFIFQGSRVTELPQLSARIKKQLSIEHAKRRSKNLLSILAGKGDRRGQRFAFKHGGKIVVLALNEILWIEAEDGHACIHTLTEKYPLKMSVKAAMSCVNPKFFFQVNASTIVNINVIRELRFGRGLQTSVALDHGREFQATKKSARQLRKLMDAWAVRSTG